MGDTIGWFIAAAGVFSTIMMIVGYVVGRRDGKLDENRHLREEMAEYGITVCAGVWTYPDTEYKVDRNAHKYRPNTGSGGKW